MTISFAEFAVRRQALLRQLPDDSIVLLVAAPEYKRNADTEFLYRQESHFYYLTGFTEPEAVCVLMPPDKFILFCRPRDPAAETWTGRRLGQTGACETLGAHEAYVITELATRLPDLLQGKAKVYYTLGYQHTYDEQLIEAMNNARGRARGKKTPLEIVEVAHLIAEQRLIKSKAEIDLMRHAAEISAKAHQKAMIACRPNLYEYTLEAEYRYEFTKNGSFAPAYPCIVGSGANACILHYVENNQPLKAGDLVLVDAGAEYQYYAADITRTFPVNGKFSEPQRAIYELVLRAQLAGIAAVVVGNPWDKTHEIIVNILTEGLVALGILSGDVASLIEQNAYQKFYMHKSSHWLGLDVHDAGAYYDANGKSRLLQAGMVITVEPGIYISENSDVDPKWWNIGVRIEDDVLVTPEGPDVLSHGAPKTIAEIEQLMAGAQ